ncbi:TIGR03545 family protein [Bdellovibrio bacteriovorus]
MTTNQDNSSTKPQKKKGIIRWEAIIPFTIIVAIIALYFHLFFDAHLKAGMEWVGYKAVGAEVNIAKVETSFFNASLRIQGIEVTNAEQPTHNSINIGDIRFSMLWDALLRAKAVINEAAVEQIAFGVKRKYPGKVKPPEPPSTEPGMAEQLKEQALKEAQQQTGENILGDIIAMLGGTDSQAQMDKLQAKLASKAMIEKFQTDLTAKQTVWNQKIKVLPQEKDVRALNERLNKIKYQDFKNPQELQASLQALEKVRNDGDAMVKQVQTTSTELQADLKAFELQYKEIDKQVKADIKALEQHFRIPKFDAKAITMGVFNHYLGPYKAKFYRYKAMADRYIPPGLKKKDTADDAIPIQPHPREKGISYEFGRLNAYPLFWIKRTAVSSQAGTTPEAGNIKGEILDITSNQKVTGKPTVANISGDFPGKEIFGFLVKVSLNNIKPESEIDYVFKVGSYSMLARQLVSSPDVQIGFNRATGSLGVEGKIVGLKQVSVSMNNTFNKIDYLVSSKNEIADQILKAVFAGIPEVNLNVSGEGVIPNIPLSINSNLGLELQKGFEKQIQAKINEARKKIELMVEEEIGKQKKQVDAQMTQLRAQLEGDVKKVQAQLEDEKKKAEARADQAKKDAESRGKKQLEGEAKKAAEELKKKFGF